MAWRGLVVMGALLVGGIAGGFVVGELLRDSSVTSGAPEPVVAEDPSIPVDPPPPLREDPSLAPLATDLPLREVSVGTDKHSFSFPAPLGWTRRETSSNEVKYQPADNPNNTYVLRVEQVLTQHEQIPDILADRIEEVEREEEDYQELRRTYDSLEFSYVHDGYRRFSLVTWLDINRSGQAEAEIAITGRAVDVPGMHDLMAEVIRGIRAG